MQIPVLIECVANNGYRSRGDKPFTTGNAREDVMQNLPETHALAKFAGMFKDDPLFEKWQKSIAKYRRDVDTDPNYL